MRHSKVQLAALVTLVLSHFALLSCHTVQNDFAREKSEALEFRRLVGVKDFKHIYQNASEPFKRATNEEDFVNILTPIAEQISNPNDFELIRRSTYVSLLDTPLTVLGFEHKGSGSVAFDEFVFIEEDGKCRLYNYRTEGR